MNPFNQMTVIAIAGIIGFLVAVVIMAMVKPSSQPANSSFPAEVIEHSKKYAGTLGSKPFEQLNTNHKLILIQSYYNLENYKIVVQHAETMIDELRVLPLERKIAFTDMIEDAYRRLGQDNIVTEFREAVGLEED